MLEAVEGMQGERSEHVILRYVQNKAKSGGLPGV